MVKVFRLPSWAGVLLLFALLALITVSIPLFMIGAGAFVFYSIAKNLLGIQAPKYSQSKPVNRHENHENSESVVENKRIGNYRIKSDSNDPSVIEVLDP